MTQEMFRVGASGFAVMFALSLGAVASHAQDAAEAPDRADEYARLLQEISDRETNIAAQGLYVEQQNARIAALERQIVQAPEIGTNVLPLLKRMAAQIDTIIQDDIPFKLGERGARYAKLVEDLDSETVSMGEKMRRTLDVFEIETSYGYGMEAYEGEHPLNRGQRFAACQEDLDSAACALPEDLREELDANAKDPLKGRGLMQMDAELQDGTYLRTGRISLGFMDVTGSEMLNYDPVERSWEVLSGSDAVNLRRAVRIARGEAAPAVVRAPVLITEESVLN